MLHDLGHVTWVGSVIYRPWTAPKNGRLRSKWWTKNNDRDMSDVCTMTSSACVSCELATKNARYLSDTTVVWPHAINYCVPQSFMLVICLTGPSPWPRKATHGGFWPFLSHFRLVSNKIRPAYVAPQVIETEKQILPTTVYQAPTK